jgi:hypothetical protein
MQVVVDENNRRMMEDEREELASLEEARCILRLEGTPPRT